MRNPKAPTPSLSPRPSPAVSRNRNRLGCSPGFPQTRYFANATVGRPICRNISIWVTRTGSARKYWRLISGHPILLHGKRKWVRTTAVRWARHLRALGHRVEIAKEDTACRADMMVALHAWRSAASIARFAERRSDRPLVVGLGGTDIYRFQHSHPDETIRSMDLAHALVCLHDLVHRSIPERFGGKLRVIHQSAPPLSPSRCLLFHPRRNKLR